MKSKFNVNPMCKKCDEAFSIKRYKLGYRTCLTCGSEKRMYTIAPAYNKGAYQLISRNYIRDIGK